MRIQVIAVVGLGALVLALVIAVTPRAATSPQSASPSVDILGLTKAAGAMPVQAFPAH